MELKEIENKIGQLQYEISCLGLDKEDLTGVSIRTEELKGLVKKLTIPVVVGRSEQLVCPNCKSKHIGTSTHKGFLQGYCFVCSNHWAK